MRVISLAIIFAVVVLGGCDRSDPGARPTPVQTPPRTDIEPGSASAKAPNDEEDERPPWARTFGWDPFVAYPSVEPLDSLAHLDSDAIARHNATVNAFLSAHEDGANAVLHSQFPLGDHGLIVATRLVTEEGQMRVVRLRYGADQSARDRTLRWSLPNQGVVTEWTVGLHSGDGFTAVENIAKQTAPLVIRWRASSVNWKLFPVGPPRSTR